MCEREREWEADKERKRTNAHNSEKAGEGKITILLLKMAFYTKSPPHRCIKLRYFLFIHPRKNWQQLNWKNSKNRNVPDHYLFIWAFIHCHVRFLHYILSSVELNFGDDGYIQRISVWISIGFFFIVIDCVCVLLHFSLALALFHSRLVWISKCTESNKKHNSILIRCTVFFSLCIEIAWDEKWSVEVFTSNNNG